MPRERPKRIRPARPGEADYYGNSFALIATCECGREREIPNGYNLTGGDYLEIQKMRARLRCSKCGARNPKVEIYSRPRPEK